MRINLVTSSLATLILSCGLVLATGCSGASSTTEGDEGVLSEAEALSAESTSSDPAEEGATTDVDVEAASAEAADGDTDENDPGEANLGCGFRKDVRAKIKAQFDANGDGKLDQGEREALKDALQGKEGKRPDAKVALRKIIGAPRHEVIKHIKWAFDSDGDGQLGTEEREELATAVHARCEARKAKALAKFDANGNGVFDDGELKAAIAERGEARRAKLKELFGKYDINGDKKLDETERAALKSDIRARMTAKKEAIKAKYDTNGDGKLDETELAQLKSDLRTRFENVTPVD